MHEKPWAWKVKHGTGGRKKQWKREYWILSVKRAYLHWTGCCWANVLLQHVIETKETEAGKVAIERRPLKGVQHWSSGGRADIELSIPGHGATYLHILCWYHFYGGGQFKDWKDFRYKCWKNSMDVDHGDEGVWRINSAGDWDCYTNVHKLTLKTDSINRSQGEPVRQKYSAVQAMVDRKRMIMRKNRN